MPYVHGHGQIGQDQHDQNNKDVEGQIETVQELASLREQLKENELELKHWMDQHVQIKWTVSDLNDKLKQKEDENRELVESLEDIIKYSPNAFTNNKIRSIIQRAKNLSA